MTSAEQATLDTFRDDLYRYLDLFKESVDDKFDTIDKKIGAVDTKIEAVKKKPCRANFVEGMKNAIKIGTIIAIPAGAIAAAIVAG